jgi:hypothetical protein
MELKFSVHYRAPRIDVAPAEDHMEASRARQRPPIQVVVHDDRRASPGAQHEFCPEHPP